MGTTRSTLVTTLAVVRRVLQIGDKAGSMPIPRLRLGKCFCLLYVIVSGLIAPVLSTAKRAMTVEDSVRTRRIVGGEVEISPDGKRLAYVVKAPNLLTNKNDFILYVRQLDHVVVRDNGRALFRADTLRRLRWLRDSRHIAVLAKEGDKYSVNVIDPGSGKRDVLMLTSKQIASYSVSARGDVAVVAAHVPRSGSADSDDKAARGFRIVFGQGVPSPNPSGSSLGKMKSEMCVVRRLSAGGFKTTVFQPLQVPGLTDDATSFDDLSLSPDGRYVTFRNFLDSTPSGWEDNIALKWTHARGTRTPALILCDVGNGHCRIGFQAPWADWGIPVVWSNDSLAFTVNALSPVGSQWEMRDKEAGFSDGNDMESYSHLFAVSVADGKASLVLSKAAVWNENGTLEWKEHNGEMLVRVDDKTFARFVPDGLQWRETEKMSLALGPINLRSSLVPTRPSLASKGDFIAGIRETTMTPPDLFVYDRITKQTSIITDLNPEYKEIDLGAVTEVDWNNRYGKHFTGYLIKPVGYELGKTYPLVIMAKGWTNFFTGDTQFRSYYAPQVLANHGFVVLLASDGPTSQNTITGFPGEMAEAYDWMSMVESAVDLLVKQGIAERSNVGIQGFSRSSWATDFMLTHSEFPFAAASSADSGVYNYGSYWLHNQDRVMKSYETQFGGPPYGDTLQNWLKYTPAFNASKVKTPLLMEYGSGEENVRDALELFVALNREHKPVELYWYPGGDHPLDKPLQRLASLQRNVDWFRFWMQGYESPNPQDRAQYARWRLYRTQLVDSRRTDSAHDSDKEKN
jgi:dipeptidyl aminopeptidase/acylaminoacyl peptidase